uniref:Uncharacterized protein n=1 Tax=Arundo donax TaxID=35708 RepID=A0A0A8ZZS8_ARUDO
MAAAARPWPPALLAEPSRHHRRSRRLE